MRIGFVGLGSQGAPIVHRMLQRGGQVTVWARRPEALAPFVSAGAAAAASLADLGRDCDLIGVCVAKDDDVRQVLVGKGGGILSGIRAGAVIAIHSTVAPETVIELESLARARGAQLLDAPVSGGPTGALAGTMTVMVGGSSAALEIARPVFELFAETIPHLGEVGSGQLMKLLNNNLCYANAVMSIDALEIAAGLGVNPERAAEIMKASSGASRGLDIVTDAVLLAKAAGPTSNVRKDAGHFQHLLEARGLASGQMALAAKSAADTIQSFAKSKA